MSRCLLIASAVLAGLLAGGPAAAGPIHLSLGDSSAFGETDRTRNPSDGDRGYVAPFADYLGTRYGARPQVINLALDGETTTSFFTGKVSDRASLDGIFHNTNYAAFAPQYPAQAGLFLAKVAEAQAAGNPIKTVSVQIGANDLFTVAEAAGFLQLPPGMQHGKIV